MDKVYRGACIDNRTEENKLKDYKFDEFVSSPAPVDWKEKPASSWRKFPIFDQGNSGSCVAQTMAKLMGIMYWLKEKVYVHFSATHIYQRRSNKPEGGMAGDDVFKIAQQGVTLEELVPSQKMSDSEMDSVTIPEYKKRVGEVFKIKNWLWVQPKNIETVASIIQQTGKGVMVWYYFKHDEWDKDPSVKYPNLELYGSDTSRHSVSAVDFTLYKGKKAIVVDDSWGPSAGNGAGQRVIDEDFFSARNFYVAYPINFVFEDQTQNEAVDKPKYKFTKTLRFSSAVKYGDADVIALQNCMKYLGFFPKNVESTGYFGAATKNAAIAFQKSRGLVADGIIGPKSIEILNSIFSA